MSKKIFGGVSPASILETGQILRFSVVQAMLSQFGFELKNGSDVKFTHPQIQRFLHNDHLDYIEIPKAPNTLNAQRHAAKICLAMHEERKQKREAETERLKTVKQDKSIAAEAEKNSYKSDIYDLQGEFPDITISPHPENPNIVVLRDKKHPSVGTITPRKNEINYMRGVIGTVTSRASYYNDNLEDAIERYELSVEPNEDGTLTLYQPQYDLEIQIAPFDPLNDDDAPYYQLEDYTDIIRLRDSLFRDETFKLMADLSALNVARLKEDKYGNTRWQFSPLDIADPTRGAIIEFTVSPTYRISPEDFLQMEDARYHLDTHFMAAKGDLEFAAKIGHYFGFKCEENTDGYLEVFSPIYPDEKCILHKPSSFSPLQKLWDELQESDNADEQTSLLNALSETFTQRREELETFRTFIDDFAYKYNADIQYTLKRINEFKNNYGGEVLPRSNIQHAKGGTFIRIELAAKDFPAEHNLKTRALYRGKTKGGNDFLFYIHPDDCPEINRFFDAVDQYFSAGASHKTHMDFATPATGKPMLPGLGGASLNPKTAPTASTAQLNIGEPK